MAKRILVLVIGIAVLSLCGCGKPYLATAGANAYVRRGLFQEALGKYLQVFETGSAGDVVGYNIGNVYYYLGDKEKALEMWEAGAESSLREVRYRSYFNTGVLLYGMNSFETSAEAFLAALKLYPDRSQPRINLEYCIRQIEAQEKKQAAYVNGVPEESPGTGGDELEMFINILLQSEKTSWSTEESAANSLGTQQDW